MRRLALLALLHAACGGDDDSVPDCPCDAAPTPDAASAPDAEPADAGGAVLPEQLPDPLPTGAPAATIVTYNVAFTQLIKYPEERMPLVRDAVAALEADIVCLQEVFLQYTTPPAFAATLSAEFPYSFWTWSAETPFSHGVLILSKHPLYRGRELFFGDEGGAVDRAVLAVDVVANDSYFHFFCAHLEAFSPAATTQEIQAAAAWLTELGYQDDPVIWAGDFNTGPFTGCPFASCEDTEDLGPYNEILLTWTDASDGFPAAGECTYCRLVANPLQLIPVMNQYHDKRIDHCMYRNLGASTPQSVTVILDDIVTYEAAGATQMTQRSDHRGVECVFGG